MPWRGSGEFSGLLFCYYNLDVRFDELERLLRSLSIVNPFHIPRPEAVNIELQDFSRY
jgi:hypothetical protein